MSEGCNADAPLHGGPVYTNTAHLSHQTSVRIWTPVNKKFSSYDRPA
jgi:hypothetical protein